MALCEKDPVFPLFKTPLAKAPIVNPRKFMPLGQPKGKVKKIPKGKEPY